MPIQSCGQSVSARRENRYTEIGLLSRTASYDVTSYICPALADGLNRKRAGPPPLEHPAVVAAAAATGLTPAQVTMNPKP
jgi:hypothetical protein